MFVEGGIFMQCIKVEGKLNNYEEELNRIIKEKRKKNMYLKEAYLENNVIVLVFSINENAICKKRTVAVQGKIKNYKDKYDFIRTQTTSRRSFGDHMYITWSVVGCLEFDGKYLLFITRKRRGYHRKKR